MNKVQILDQEGITARLLRMAYEIYEANYHEKSLYIIGIDERGGFMGKQLLKHLQNISPLELHFINAHLDRSGGQGEIGIELGLESLESLRDQSLLLVDDVLYSGSTLLNVVAILLQAKPAKLRTAVLIDRGHRQMPVSADFVGLELATTLQQHVSIEIADDQEMVQAFLL
jgi:pyrimidine operon attenuation protein/uracil phosphoribosyltransferase